MKELSVEEWMAELTAVTSKDGDGCLTTDEIAAKTNRSAAWVRKNILRPARDRGILRVVQRRQESLAGASITIPAYGFTRTKPGRTRRPAADAS